MKDERVTTLERKQVKTPPAQLVAAKEEDEEAIDDSHNWRGIAISLLVILAICSIIALAIILLTPSQRIIGDGLAHKIHFGALVETSFENSIGEAHIMRGFALGSGNPPVSAFMALPYWMHTFCPHADKRRPFCLEYSTTMHYAESLHILTNSEYDEETLSVGNTGSGQRGDRFTLSDILQGRTVPRKFNGSWISDDQLEFRNKEGDLVIYSVRTKATKKLVDNMTFSEHGVERYSISADQKYVLLLYDIKKIYRYSFHAKYKIYEVSTRKIFSLVADDAPESYLRYVAWGPRGNQLVYVYENNIYYVPEVNDTHYAITSTGVKGIIFNGVTDWLYEEELLHTDKAIWWSPDGNLLCFATFNDSKLGTLYYEYYGQFNDSENTYPEPRHIRYPKPGQDNPSAFLWVVDLHNPNKILQRDVKPPREVQDQDHYFTSVRWIDNQSLAVIWMARSQNYSVVTQCTGTLWYCSPIYEQRPPSRKGWVDLYDEPIVGENGRCWFLKLPLPEGIHGHYRHVAVAYNDSRHVDYLTQGRYDIVKILAYHEGTNTVYYISTKENRPGERHLYSVSGKKARFTTYTKCLTCDEGYACLYNNAIFSPSSEFYVFECLGPGVPRIEIRSIYNDTFEILDGNDDLRTKVQKTTLPQMRTFQVSLPSGYRAQVRLLLPPGLAEDEILLYPLVVQGCGAPGSQLVTSEFDINWGTYLSSQRNYIYAWIDGRGSGYQGDKFLHETYYHLGTAEVEDQVEVVRYLRDNLPFVNPSHIAIWGWGYGGYVAASALTVEDTVFKCAMGVAPITNWLYYDSAFTERYMGTPEAADNYLGYLKGNLLKKAKKFRGKKLLLVHGTSDDNVHFQHSAMLMKALVDEGVIFHTQIYVDEGHYLHNVRKHLYRTLEDFLAQCFYIKRKDDYDASVVRTDDTER